MGLVDGYKMDFINDGTRRGRECIVANIVRNSPVSVRRARENSLSVQGSKMFNLLPADIFTSTILSSSPQEEQKLVDFVPKAALTRDTSFTFPPLSICNTGFASEV